MKFKFETQQYQQDAVNSICKVFEGQPFLNMVKYVRDLGIKKQENTSQINFLAQMDAYNQDDIGFENAKILLNDGQILDNIRNVQQNNNLILSDELVDHLGRCSLDIEMETGTGKTYVYINSIFELNLKYGWSKFIIVVPSIAIREGAKKSFEITEEHFQDKYGKKARYFIYNSKDLTRLDSFSSSSDIQVMIINAQAFNARGIDARRIDMALDEFQSRRPIDVVSKNRPILILDEPQKLGGDATQRSLKKFNPLFLLNFSATHKKHHNLVYCLDALDAYNKKLVKKIEVKGFEVKNLRGTDGYLRLENILLSSTKPPVAKVEIEVGYNKSINRETRNLNVGDNLFIISKNMEQYKNNYVVSEINPFNNTVTFLNGEILEINKVVGDLSERNLRRIQIRETIISHFEKEQQLFERGIKCLSLFFIDHVANYRDYDKKDEKGEYARVFEEEYNKALNDYIEPDNSPYMYYLKNIKVEDTHKGYFSIDKKTNHLIDSKENKGEGGSDDISAYDLILIDKARLLSYEEPTRFIFSHSALREGWDNPNVFQICALKHSDSTIAKRQEVGRGLRISVNNDGERANATYCQSTGNDFHKLNTLTVIATDSYQDFVTNLQREIKENLADRPVKATMEYFKGKIITDGIHPIPVDDDMASDIQSYLRFSGYIDKEYKLTDKYRADFENNSLIEMQEIMKPYEASIQNLIQSIFDEKVLQDMIADANQSKIIDNKLNDNFYKKEFKALWDQINHQYSYMVDFKSDELIKNSIRHIDEKLIVSQLKYIVTSGLQKKVMDKHAVERGESFGTITTRTETLSSSIANNTPYDLVGKIAAGTNLTRKTIVKILKGIQTKKFDLFKVNPEEFINKTIKLINEQKATMIVDHITYNQTEGKFDNTIFTANQINSDFNKVFKATKHIQDYVVTDGLSEKSVERKFAEDLESAKEVCVYAKLPRTFYIPTPVGNYSPDWAIAFYDNMGIKHIYFIAETKGTMESMELKPIEQAKIKCAHKLFNELSTTQVRYYEVTSYQDLLDVINQI
ncbi:MAG: type III restriction-modification system endonuclease [Spirochaetales bacterium]